MLDKYAVFCSKGLGDGLIFALVANNIRNNRLKVTVFHDGLSEVEKTFPGIEIKKYPNIEDVREELSSFNKIIINTDSSDINIEVQKIGLELLPNDTYLLHATTCKGKNLPGNYYLDSSVSLVSNLVNFCQNKLKLTNIIKDNGIQPAKTLIHRKYKNRIVFHVTSTSTAKNWPIEKYMKLEKKLKKKGYSVSYIFSNKERKKYLWMLDRGLTLPNFDTLSDIVSYIYESGFMIGNDSGIGHLASCLKIPTCTIFSSKRKKLFWRPDFHISEEITAWNIIPNIKGMRFRELYWKSFVEVYRVQRKFNKLRKRVS